MWQATLLTLQILQCSSTVCSRSQCLLSQPPDRPVPPTGVDRRALLSRAVNDASKRVRPRPFPDGGRGGGRFSTPPLASVPYKNVLVACREENSPLSWARRRGVPYSLRPTFHLPLSYFPGKKIPGVEGSRFFYDSGGTFIRSVRLPLLPEEEEQGIFLSFRTMTEGGGEAVFSVVRPFAFPP